MKIEKFTYQNRRDFKAIFVCEHCGFKKEEWGYDDSNFHHNILPTWPCPQCGKKVGDDYRPLETRYPDFMEV